MCRFRRFLPTKSERCLLPNFYFGSFRSARLEKILLQLAVQMILEVTQWEVIDWTPASFIPHFLEETQLRQYGASGTHEEVLALSTLFMIGKPFTRGGCVQLGISGMYDSDCNNSD